MRKFKYSVVLLMAFLSFSCELDINDDPNNPIAAPLNQVLRSASGNMAFRMGLNANGLNTEASVFAHQLMNFRADQYNITPQSYGNEWDDLYARSLTDFQYVIDNGTASGDLVYVGIAKLQKAFIFMHLVDLFGDVPYFDAIGAQNGVTIPNVDPGEEVYADLFNLIDEGMQDIRSEEGTVPVGNDDLIFGGNPELWLRFGNTLKLRMYNTARLSTLFNASEVSNLISKDSLFLSSANDFEFYFVSSTIQEQNPGFQNCWTNTTSRESQISHFFYERMKGLNDPRMNYYWFNQIPSGGSAQNPTDYQDETADGLFVTSRFGAEGPDANFSQNNSFSLPGLYIVGGAYNDGSGGIGNASTAGSGAGTAPVQMLTYHSMLFILAELAQEEGITGAGDARQLFSDAMQASFEKVNAVANSTGITGADGNAAPPIAQADIDDYIGARLAEYDAANATDKLEILMQQKAIANFGSGIESYCDIRRTGHPAIYDPNTDDDPTTNSPRGYPLSLPYPNTEADSNPNIVPKTDLTEAPVFWDAN